MKKTIQYKHGNTQISGDISPADLKRFIAALDKLATPIVRYYRLTWRFPFIKSIDVWEGPKS